MFLKFQLFIIHTSIFEYLYIYILTFALTIHIDSDKVAFKILKCLILGIEQSVLF